LGAQRALPDHQLVAFAGDEVEEELMRSGALLALAVMLAHGRTLLAEVG
jgi:hypothetical protein